MTYPEKRDVLVRLELVLVGAVRNDRSRRLMYVDDPSVLLVLTQALSGEVVARTTLSVSSTPIEEKYVVGYGSSRMQGGNGRQPAGGLWNAELHSAWQTG
jgi:hypothetical protein